MHLYAHAEYMFGGDFNPDTDVFTPPVSVAGVAGAVTTALSANPFSAASAYDPTGVGEPYASLVPTFPSATYAPADTMAKDIWTAAYNALKSTAATEFAAGATALGGLDTTAEVETAWETLYAAVVAAIDTSFATAQLSARQGELNVEFLQSAEKLMGLFNGLDSFDSTTFWSALAQLDATRTMEANRFYAELLAQAGTAALAIPSELIRTQASILTALASHAQAHGTALAQASSQVTQASSQKEAVDIAYMELSLKAVEQYMTAVRQNIEDELKLDVQDTLWELQTWEHFGKAIGAIGGAQVIPGHPNPILETISGVSSLVSPVLGFAVSLIGGGIL